VVGTAERGGLTSRSSLKKIGENGKENLFAVFPGRRSDPYLPKAMPRSQKAGLSEPIWSEAHLAVTVLGSLCQAKPQSLFPLVDTVSENHSIGIAFSI
jgi:hypothetical protein